DFAGRHGEVRSEIESLSYARAGFAPDKAIETPGEIPFPRLRIAFDQFRRDGEAKHAVAQEFQPLIIRNGARAAAGMSEGFGQKLAALEPVAEPFLKLSDFRLPAHA